MKCVYEAMNRSDLLRGSGCGSERQRGCNNKIVEDLKKMNINRIGTTGYPAWQGARKAEGSAKGDFGANVKSTGNVVHIDPDAVFSIHHVKTGESANV